MNKIEIMAKRLNLMYVNKIQMRTIRLCPYIEKMIKNYGRNIDINNMMTNYTLMDVIKNNVV